MREVLQKQSNKSDGLARENVKSGIETSSIVKDSSLSANQLAAKALQLRMKGKHEEAQKLLESKKRGLSRLSRKVMIMSIDHERRKAQTDMLYRTCLIDTGRMRTMLIGI